MNLFYQAKNIYTHKHTFIRDRLIKKFTSPNNAREVILSLLTAFLNVLRIVYKGTKSLVFSILKTN